MTKRSNNHLTDNTMTKTPLIAALMTLLMFIPLQTSGINISTVIPGHSWSATEATEYQYDDENEQYIDETEAVEHHDPHTPISDRTILLWFIGFLLVAAIDIGMFVLVGVMARNRHRSVAVWLLLSFFGSPFLMAIILLIIGNSYSNYGPY